VVTGEVDSGKTSWCLALARGEPGCDGVLLRKVYRAGGRVGYDAQRVATGARVPFARRQGAELSRWRPVERVGAFSISAAGKRSANRWLLEALASSPRGLIVDEIGPLELSAGGLAESLPRVIADFRARRLQRLILVVRRSCLEAVVERFGLPGHRLIELG